MGQTELSAFRSEGLFSVTLVPKGTVLAEAGAKVDVLSAVVEGRVMCSTAATDGSYCMEESLSAPVIIQPHRLFGLSQRYVSTYSASTVCKVMTIKKNDVVRMIEESMVFRINFLNVITSMAEKLERSLWHQKPEDLPHKVVRFIKDRCQYPAGHKVLHINMLSLARELGCSRIEVSNALHCLEDRELLRIKRGGVEVPMMELLLKFNE